jgi:hypothetical protein
LHSALGTRLAQFLANLRGDAALADRFVRELEVDGRDSEAAARLFLAYEMARNRGGVVLCASRQARHIARNAELRTTPPDQEQVDAFERFLVTL